MYVCKGVNNRMCALTHCCYVFKNKNKPNHKIKYRNCVLQQGWKSQISSFKTVH